MYIHYCVEMADAYNNLRGIAVTDISEAYGDDYDRDAYKEYKLPDKPSTTSEACAILGRCLDLIYSGKGAGKALRLGQSLALYIQHGDDTLKLVPTEFEKLPDWVLKIQDTSIDAVRPITWDDLQGGVSTGSITLAGSSEEDMIPTLKALQLVFLYSMQGFSKSWEKLKDKMNVLRAMADRVGADLDTINIRDDIWKIAAQGTDGNVNAIRGLIWGTLNMGAGSVLKSVIQALVLMRLSYNGMPAVGLFSDMIIKYGMSPDKLVKQIANEVIASELLCFVRNWNEKVAKSTDSTSQYYGFMFARVFDQSCMTSMSQRGLPKLMTCFKAMLDPSLSTDLWNLVGSAQDDQMMQYYSTFGAGLSYANLTGENRSEAQKRLIPDGSEFPSPVMPHSSQYGAASSPGLMGPKGEDELDINAIPK